MSLRCFWNFRMFVERTRNMEKNTTISASKLFFCCQFIQWNKKKKKINKTFVLFDQLFDFIKSFLLAPSCSCWFKLQNTMFNNIQKFSTTAWTLITVHFVILYNKCFYFVGLLYLIYRKTMSINHFESLTWNAFRKNIWCRLVFDVDNWVYMYVMLFNLQMRLRWLCNFTLGWFATTFTFTNKCISCFSQS